MGRLVKPRTGWQPVHPSAVRKLNDIPIAGYHQPSTEHNSFPTFTLTNEALQPEPRPCSLDGGLTWRNIQLPHLTFQTGATGALAQMDAAGDPAIAFGPNNSVYYANLVFSRRNDASGIVVNKSVDGGLTWGEPGIVRLDGVDASGNPVATPLSKR